MGTVAVRPEPNEMTGEEMVRVVQELRKVLRYRTDAKGGGADEIGVCIQCRRPFFYSSRFRDVPENCGRNACMTGQPEQEIDFDGLLEEAKKSRRKGPPRTKKPPIEQQLADDYDIGDPQLAAEPICECICHLNAYQEAWGFVPDRLSLVEVCEHCIKPE